MLELTRREVLLRHAARESISRAAARSLPLVVKRAQGVEVWSVEGKRYLDFSCGGGALALGHNHPRVVAALRGNLDDLAEVHDFPAEIRDAFVSELLDFLPPSMKNRMKVHLCAPSGSDAVETAIRLCKQATGRSGVIAFHGAWHGATAGALATSAPRAAKHRVFALMPDVTFAPYSYCLRCPLKLEPSSCGIACAAMLETIFEDSHSGIPDPAAVLIEFMQGEGGSIAALPEFAKRVTAAAQRAEVPLIADEVQTGLGRTGRWWAFEHFAIEPDVIVVANALGGIGLPVAVTLYRNDLDVGGVTAPPTPFRGNQLALVAGRAALAVLREQPILENVVARGDQLKNGLYGIAGRTVAEVRGAGLMLGIEFADPETNAPLPEVARRVRDECFARGLFCALGGRKDATLRLLPPLTVTAEEVDEALSILGGAIHSVTPPQGGGPELA
jgi:diaminobutyrate-2-oxoglutarate transaminase